MDRGFLAKESFLIFCSRQKYHFHMLIKRMLKNVADMHRARLNSRMASSIMKSKDQFSCNGKC